MVIEMRSCSWCHELVRVEETTCPECGHDAQRPRLHCTCAKCRAERARYDAGLQQRTPDGRPIEDGHILD